MFKGLRNAVIVAGVIVGGTYAFYRFGLSDGARNGLKFAYNTVKESYTLITNTIDKTLGIVVKENDANRAVDAAEAQWEAIGY